MGHERQRPVVVAVTVAERSIFVLSFQSPPFGLWRHLTSGTSIGHSGNRLPVHRNSTTNTGSTADVVVVNYDDDNDVTTVLESIYFERQI